MPGNHLFTVFIFRNVFKRLNRYVTYILFFTLSFRHHHFFRFKNVTIAVCETGSNLPLIELT